MENNKSKTKFKTAPFDDGIDYQYSATIRLGPNVDVDVDFKVPPPTEKGMHLCIDDLYNVLYRIMDKKYPEKNFPTAQIIALWIHANGGRYRVVGESDKKTIAKLRRGNQSFLVLPECEYAISPRYKLFLKMQELGLIGKDDEFDPALMDKLIQSFR